MEELKNKLNRSLAHLNPEEWGFTCSNDDFTDDDLRELAKIHDIKKYKTLTREKLCAALTIVIKVALFKKKAVQKKILPECTNLQDILGEDVTSILPQYFISYTSNGKIFCEDVRNIISGIEAGYSTNPYTNIPFTDDQINAFIVFYNSLEMDDEETEKTLTQVATDMVSMLFYPNSVSLYLTADDHTISDFANELELPNAEYDKYELAEYIIDLLSREPDETHRVSEAYNMTFTEELIAIKNAIASRDIDVIKRVVESNTIDLSRLDSKYLRSLIDEKEYEIAKYLMNKGYKLEYGDITKYLSREDQDILTFFTEEGKAIYDPEYFIYLVEDGIYYIADYLLGIIDKSIINLEFLQDNANDNNLSTIVALADDLNYKDKCTLLKSLLPYIYGNDFYSVSMLVYEIRQIGCEISESEKKDAISALEKFDDEDAAEILEDLVEIPTHQ